MEGVDPTEEATFLVSAPSPNDPVPRALEVWDDVDGAAAIASAKVLYRASSR